MGVCQDRGLWWEAGGRHHVRASGPRLSLGSGTCLTVDLALLCLGMIPEVVLPHSWCDAARKHFLKIRIQDYVHCILIGDPVWNPRVLCSIYS